MSDINIPVLSDFRGIARAVETGWNVIFVIIVFNLVVFRCCVHFICFFFVRFYKKLTMFKPWKFSQALTSKNNSGANIDKDCNDENEWTDKENDLNLSPTPKKARSSSE